MWEIEKKKKKQVSPKGLDEEALAKVAFWID